VIDYVAVFVFFFAVIDPVGTVPVFLAVTRGHDDASRRAIAVRAAAIAAAILVFFVVAGELVLSAMEIPLSAFQVGGGIVLFLFALTMIFGESKPEEELRMADAAQETAVFPLAVPSLASPGAMLAAVLLTENSRFGLLEQAQTTLVMLAVLLVALVLMLAAGALYRFLGDSGASVVSRVMGMILASVAAANVLAGIQAYFGL
jgi:multiple antibiotic resistance protein